MGWLIGDSLNAGLASGGTSEVLGSPLGTVLMVGQLYSDSSTQ